MSRRRLSALGKMAVSVADRALHALDLAPQEVPIVWASRYGDAQRSLELLRQQAQGEPLSPTAFGLSVHNGIAAQHSIQRTVHANGLCVAAGQHTAEAGLVEALGLLAEGHEHVLLVCYDTPLPGEYAVFHDEAAAPYAWAWLLKKAQTGVTSIALQTRAMTVSLPGDNRLPHGLQVLHWMLSQSSGASTQWHWDSVHA